MKSYEKAMDISPVIKENFFVLDSGNMHETKNRLYGYFIQNGKIFDGREENPEQVSPDGVYVHICRKGSKLIISQDYSGSFGLYLYQREGYFALSNSFMYLAEWLKSKEKLHVNMDYVMSMFAFDLCSLSVEETPLQEIQMLPRNARVLIDIDKNDLSIERIDYREESVPIDSKEGMAILDEWHEKWTSLIRYLKGRTNNISVDLSGGFDSRITFALFASAGINLDEVRIESIHDELHTHAEDYEIASEIASFYHTALNGNAFSEAYQNLCLQDIMDISFFTKMGFHKEMYYQYRRYDKPVYTFGGSGGETLRDYWNMIPEAFIEWQSGLGSIYIVKEIREAAARILARSLETVCRDYGSGKDEPEAVMRLYLEARSRNHFGKAAVENYFSNTIKLMPLMDRNLHMLKTVGIDGGDKDFLFLLILARYADTLLEFKLEGGRSFAMNTIQAARRISKKYPLMKEQQAIVSLDKNLLEAENPCQSVDAVKYEEIHSEIMERFMSEKFRERFLQVFSDDIYAFAQQFARDKKFFPLKYVYSAMAADYALAMTDDKYANCTLIKDIKVRGGNRTPLQLSYRSTVLKAFLSLFYFARIDLKNIGGPDNDLLFDLPAGAEIKNPDWFQNGDGTGYQLESSLQALHISFVCRGNGELKIWLRGLDVRDSKRRTIPFYVDYTFCSFNQEILLKEPTPIWHDKPLVITRKVANGERCSLELRWEPHGCSKEELLNMIEKLLADHDVHQSLVRIAKLCV